MVKARGTEYGGIPADCITVVRKRDPSSLVEGRREKVGSRPHAALEMRQWW